MLTVAISDGLEGGCPLCLSGEVFDMSAAWRRRCASGRGGDAGGTLPPDPPEGIWAEMKTWVFSRGAAGAAGIAVAGLPARGSRGLCA